MEHQRQLIEKINQYQRIYERTLNQQMHLSELKHLLENPFSIEKIPFPSVVSFDFQNKAQLLQYIRDPTLYVYCVDSMNTSNWRRGIITNLSLSDQELLWVNDPGRTYITFPVRAKVDEGYQWDLETTLAELQKKHLTGHILGQHLLYATEQGQRIEYIKAYLELLSEKTSDQTSGF